jgi:hypothetical protein
LLAGGVVGAAGVVAPLPEGLSAAPAGLSAAPVLAPPPDVPPAAAPLGLVIFSSSRHFSRSVPVMPRHLLLVVLPLAPLEAPVEPLPVAEAPPDGVLPVAPALEPLDGVLPVAPALDPALPELCAMETLASAKSAAAVAALMIFNVMSVFPPYLLVPDAPPVLPEPDPLLPAPEPPMPPGFFALLSLPDAPLLGVEVLPLLPPVAPPAAAPEPDLLKYASHS